jgi:hypothetical protein
MVRLKQAVLIIRFIEELIMRQAHCTAARLQASIFFLQEAANVPLSFDYVLYKRRPFAFDLSYALTALRAEGLIQLEPHREGPGFLPTQAVHSLKALYRITLNKYEGLIAAAARSGNHNYRNEANYRGHRARRPTLTITIREKKKRKPRLPAFCKWRGAAATSLDRGRPGARPPSRLRRWQSPRRICKTPSPAAGPNGSLNRNIKGDPNEYPRYSKACRRACRKASQTRKSKLRL